MLIPIAAMFGLIAWGASVYSMFQAHRYRPPGRFTVPLFSTNPKYITAESVMWRKRFFLSAGVGGLIVIGTIVVTAISGTP